MPDSIPVLDRQGASAGSLPPAMQDVR